MNHQREQGFMIIYVTLLLPFILGVVVLVIDVGTQMVNKERVISANHILAHTGAIILSSQRSELAKGLDTIIKKNQQLYENIHYTYELGHLKNQRFIQAPPYNTIQVETHIKQSYYLAGLFGLAEYKLQHQTQATYQKRKHSLQITLIGPNAIANHTKP